MNRAIFSKDSNHDWFVLFDDNECDIPSAPFDAWIITPNEMNIFTHEKSVIRHRAEAAEAEAASLRGALEMSGKIIASVEAERNEALRQLEQAQTTAKSNAEMWALCHRQHEITDRDMLVASDTIRELRERIEEMQFAALGLTNKNIGIRHTEYEGENETPFGIALDGLGDEVEL